MERYKRQSGLMDMTKIQKKQVYLIGAGGIGGITGLMLTKMGIEKLAVFDFDTIEEHNVGNQIYGPGHVGNSKVDTMGFVCNAFDGRAPELYHHKFEGTEELPGDSIIILGVDSYSERLKIVENLVKQNKPFTIIDGRMGAEFAEVYALELQNEEALSNYLETLEGLAEPISCTARATIYCSAGISSIICSLVKKICHEQPIPQKIVLDLTNFLMEEQEL